MPLYTHRLLLGLCYAVVKQVKTHITLCVGLTVVLVICVAYTDMGIDGITNKPPIVSSMPLDSSALITVPLQRRGSRGDWRECVINIGTYFMPLNVSMYYWRGDDDSVVKKALGKSNRSHDDTVIGNGMSTSHVRSVGSIGITPRYNNINPFCVGAFRTLLYSNIRSELLFGFSEDTNNSTSSTRKMVNHNTTSFSVCMAGDSLVFRAFSMSVNKMGEPVKVRESKISSLPIRRSIMIYEPPYKKGNVNNDGYPLSNGVTVVTTVNNRSDIHKASPLGDGLRKRTNIVFLKLPYISEAKFWLPREIMNMCQADNPSPGSLRPSRPSVMFVSFGNWDMNWKIQKETKIPQFTGPRTLQGATEYWTTHTARLFAYIDYAIKTCEEHGPGTELKINEAIDENPTNTNIVNTSKHYYRSQYIENHRGIPPLIIVREQLLANCAASRFASKSRAYRQCIPLIRPVVIPLYRRVLSAVAWSLNIPVIPTDHLDRKDICRMDDGLHLNQECMHIEQQHYWNVYRLMLREWKKTRQGRHSGYNDRSGIEAKANLPFRQTHVSQAGGRRSDSAPNNNYIPFYIHSGVRQGLVYESVFNDITSISLLRDRQAVVRSNNIILDWLTIKTKEFVNISKFYGHMDRLRVWHGGTSYNSNTYPDSLYSVGDYYSWQQFPTAYGTTTGRSSTKNSYLQPPQTSQTSLLEKMKKLLRF